MAFGIATDIAVAERIRAMAPKQKPALLGCPSPEALAAALALAFLFLLDRLLSDPVLAAPVPEVEVERGDPGGVLPASLAAALGVPERPSCLN